MSLYQAKGGQTLHEIRERTREEVSLVMVVYFLHVVYQNFVVYKLEIRFMFSESLVCVLGVYAQNISHARILLDMKRVSNAS